MKFETYAYNRVVDHQKNFGKDLCTYAHTQSKILGVYVNMHLNMCAHMFLLSAQAFGHRYLTILFWWSTTFLQA